MEVGKLQRIEFYTVDLTKMKGKGELKCPKCAAKISPDDKTDETYTLIEPIMKNGKLDKLTIKCNSCRSQIRLTGFELLD